MSARVPFVTVFIAFLIGLFGAVAVHANTAEKADVRVLIDISGSMKQNDPQILRKPAMELLVKLLPDDARAGFWTFAESTRIIVPHRQVADSWRSTALNGAKRISSTGLFTNIPLALQDASRNITSDEGTDYHIILLTDGMVDVSKDPAANELARKKLIEEILPSLRKRNIKVHTIALSANADKLLMEKIAIDTGGLSAMAETADQLAKIFVQALDVAAPREQVPLKNNQFSIDKSIDEFTMLIFRQKTEEKTALLAPDGKRYDAETKASDIAWFRNEGYDLVTVKKPVTGDWKIEADLQPGSRVTIVSNLSLKSSRFPSSFFIGADERITAALTENDKPLVQDDFLKLVDINAVVTRRDDNQFWQQPMALDTAALNSANKADSPFATRLQMLAQTGTYDIVVKADGKTFQRELRQTVSVYDAFEVVVVAGKEVPPVHDVTLIPRNPEIVPANSRVVTHLTHPDGTNSLPLAVLQPNETWKLQLSDEKHSGEFRIWFEIEAKDRKDKITNYKTEPRSIIHLVPGELTTVEEIKEKPKPEPVAEVKPEPEVKHEASGEEWTLSRILTIAGIVLGNLLVAGLGYFAYRTLMAAPKKSVLEQSDDEVDETDPAIAAVIAEEEAALAATGDVLPDVQPEVVSDEPEDTPDMIDVDADMPDELPEEAVENPPFGEKEDLMPVQEEDDFALPDDAIDIDPESEDDKK